MTIIEHAKTMRLHARFPLQSWADVIDTIVYLINRETLISLDGDIVEEAWKSLPISKYFWL